ncbi:MAG: TonB-dependent receptor [Acidobacteria bacterium]|nr:TonB-dependent receptor [Acidobacteriota bacterium]
MLRIWVLAFAFLFAAPAWAGQIQGRVLNPQGAAVAGAKVAVSNQQGEGLVQAATGADGSYSIPGLEPGSYTLTVTAPSVAGTLSRRVDIPEGTEPVRADFQFQAAAAPTPIAGEERNPNIFIYRIDLNDIRNRLTVARGPDPQYIPEFRSEQNYFGAEFGAPLSSFELIRPRPSTPQWRGSIFGLHQNSVLNARNFFNVGPLRASRATSYGATGSGPLRFEKLSGLLQYSHSITSGFVNGNILVPLLTERTPQSSDPRKNAIISSLLQAYPEEGPNLENGQLNSNALRDIDSRDALARLDYKWRDADAMALRYSVSDYIEDPFQLVAGQNPQTNIRNQGAHASLTHTLSPQTVARLGFHYDRTGAILDTTRRFNELLAPLDITPVPDLDMRFEATNIGPSQKFPRLRIQNRFQLYSDLSKTRGRHTWKAGWSSVRVQVNDLQSDNSRGTLTFSVNFGRTAIQNLQFGTPTSYVLAVGNLYRGFRTWEHAFFLEDQIRPHPTLTMSLGVRYELMTAPTEVNHLTEIGFPTDKNNFAPRFGFAWNPAKGKTVVRGAYGISYSPMQPVSYGMTRFNPPAIQVIQVDNPDLLNPLAGVSQQTSGGGGRSALYQLSPELAFPYSHQYSLGVERSLPWSTVVRLSYIGMRTFHLLSQGVYNRARPSSTLPNTTATMNQRRPDPRYFDINIIESNSIAYYDAAQVAVDKRLSRGLSFRASYTFGKNIDLGGDFTNTASGVEVPPETGTSTCELCDRVSDQKSVSLFDTPQVFSLSYSYNLPFFAGTNGWTRKLFSGWQISGTTNLQSGNPYHIHTGSDAPGFGNVDGNTQDRPNVLDPSILGISIDDPDTSRCQLGVKVPGMCPDVQAKFDTILPVAGRGTLGMNTFRKDGTHNWNFAVGRTFPLPGGQERTAQFRAEFLNFFNHAQFDKAGVQIATRTFAQITNTVNKGRQVQFSLRLNF